VDGNSTLRVKVEAGDRQVVAHVGLHALGAFADRLDFGGRLSSQIGWAGERAPVHDRGTVLVQAMLMLAGGGESVADIEHLRIQDRLFGPVPSDTTLRRTILAIDPATFGDPDRFVGEVDRLIRDIRASKRLPGVERIWLPGEQSQTRRIERMKNGIPMPEPLLASLNELATELGMAPLG